MIQSGDRLAGDAGAVVTFPTQSQLAEMLMIGGVEMSMIRSHGRERRRCR
ncbi:hypothetical protein Hanom_Chr12g01123551 [Helianthus anomalus]